MFSQHDDIDVVVNRVCKGYEYAMMTKNVMNFVIRFSYHHRPHHGDMISITNIENALHVKTVIGTLAGKPCLPGKTMNFITSRT